MCGVQTAAIFSLNRLNGLPIEVDDDVFETLFAVYIIQWNDRKSTAV
jgi:hypothetical protein